MGKKYKYNEVLKETKTNALIVRDGFHVEVRIDDSYFDNKVSNIVGDRIETFGFMDLKIWDKLSDTYKISEAGTLKFRLPTTITTEPTRIEHDTTKKVRVLQYESGDKFLISTAIPKSADVVKRFVGLLTSGKIPKDIGYDEIGEYWLECCSINSTSMGVNSMFLDLITMQVARDPNNLSRQFRMALTDDPTMNMSKMKLVNMNVIPSLKSQFSAITSGNPKFGITSSIGAVRSGDMELEESDVEKLTK